MSLGRASPKRRTRLAAIAHGFSRGAVVRVNDATTQYVSPQARAFGYEVATGALGHAIRS